MSIRIQIDAAFAGRQRPANLVEARSPVTPEQRDALSFAGRHWREIDWQDWQKHPDAFYAFLPEAFIFYLPSILIGALDAPKGQLLVADALITVLDRSPDVSHWDAFMVARFVGLELAEYEALKAWILFPSGTDRGDHEDEDRLTRSYETVDLLARETAKLRRSLGESPTSGGQ